MFASVSIALFLTGAVIGDEDTQAKLRFYHGDFEDYTELPINEADSIIHSPWYNSSKMTTIFCHGFTGHPNGPAVSAVIKAYLKQGERNVALLNWDRLAASIYPQMSTSYLNYAVPNSLRLGYEFADVLLSLAKAGMDLNKTHLVGHSLGAQIMGIAGNNMLKNGVQLPWITGLDPAGIAFDSKRPDQRLNPKSAVFVDVIHSDPSKYGSKREMGTVDFWPNYRNNGPVVQPGCINKLHPRFSAEDLCNHFKCFQYLVDSMSYPGTLIGSHARNFRTWKNYSKPQRSEVVLEIGKYYKHVVPGNYYLLTTASSPYGLGENGL